MKDIKGLETLALIELVKAECDEAFSVLAERYAPLLEKQARAYFGERNQLEAMQEARIALLRAAKTYKKQADDSVTFGLYATVCVSNAMKSLLRKFVRDSEHSDRFVFDSEAAAVSGVEDSVVTRDLCERVLRAARVILSAYEYEVFSLSLDNYSTKDIAQRLGRSAKSVDNAKSRISARLRASKEVLAIVSDIY